MSQVSNWMINVSGLPFFTFRCFLLFSPALYHFRPLSFSRPRRHHHQFV
jgi:hypothetical protein